MKITKILTLIVVLSACVAMLFACDSAGANKLEEATTAHEHTVVVDKAVAPTCTKTGLTEGKHCSVCKEVIKAQEVVAKLAHTEVIDKAVEATCTEIGLTEGSHCSVCNEVIIEQKNISKKII